MTVYLDKRADETSEEAPEETVPTWSVGAIFAAVIAIPLVFMLLWNWLMPAIFSLPSIGYFKSTGLLVMSFILFKR
tara:strand:- start:540 stop:767 length:228 start_codon:yes stop_codon:yes gene_type:complete